ncbi:MAG: hypothetical protein ACPKM1_15735 [Spirochaetaceae bacterium]
MRYNRLIGLERAKALRKYGCSVVDLQTRRRGRSTALAFRALADAISRPGEWVTIQDHHPSILASRILFDRVQEIARKLELRLIEFKRAGLQIRFNLWGESEESNELS